jgi:hypothetical protein
VTLFLCRWLQIFLQAKPDILSRFIALSEKHPESYSDKYLRDIILNFMIAGREATAVTLCWFFHLLCKNPDVEEKLLQEIRDLVKEKECVSIEESISMFSQSLTHTVLDKMHYLHASLSETLRLHPAVPMVRHLRVFLWSFRYPNILFDWPLSMNNCVVTLVSPLGYGMILYSYFHCICGLAQTNFFLRLVFWKNMDKFI